MIRRYKVSYFGRAQTYETKLNIKQLTRLIGKNSGYLNIGDRIVRVEEVEEL